MSFELIGTGLFFGVIHVLTGPDHLSALATLSANIGQCKAFSYGIRWGIGHSAGLIIIAVFLITIGQGDFIEVPPLLDTILESIVGVFMILLGFFGFYQAFRQRDKKRNEGFVDRNFVLFDEGKNANRSAPITIQNITTDPTHERGHDITGNTTAATATATATATAAASPQDETLDAEANLEKNETPKTFSFYEFMCGLFSGHDHLHDNVEPPSSNMKPNKCIAFLIGILHGIAGPGGVLGVIPAVQLKTTYLSTLYLGSFCLSSTLIMGLYAAVYGTCTEHVSSKANFEFQISIFSSFLSVIVGILWLVLLSLGILDDIFP